MSTTSPATRIGFDTWRYLHRLMTPYAHAADAFGGLRDREAAVERLYLGTATEADRLLAVDIVRRTSGSIQTLIELGEPGCSHAGCRNTRSVERRDGALWCLTHYWEHLDAQRAAAKKEAA